MSILKSLMIAGVLSAVSFNTYALRCGNDLIEIGDPEYKIKQKCRIESEYRVQNALADINKIYIKDGGMTYELVVIDGKLNSMDGSRF